MKTNNIIKNLKEFFYKLTPPFYIIALMLGVLSMLSIIFSPIVERKTNEYFVKIDNTTLKLHELSLTLEDVKAKNKQQQDIVQTALALKASNAKRLTSAERFELAGIIVKQARMRNIDPILVVAQIQVESNFRNHALSNKGAKGLMQLLPDTAKYIQKKTNVHVNDINNLYDPETNIALGTAYMHYLLKKTNGNMEYALIAYNMGPSNMYRAIKKNKLPKSYSNKVLSVYNSLLLKINNTNVAQN